MMQRELTSNPAFATSRCMGTRGHGQWGKRLAWALMGGVMTMLGGCVSVNAPDKPIVIELNINIKQEVVYKIAKDVANTIEENPEIF